MEVLLEPLHGTHNSTTTPSDDWKRHYQSVLHESHHETLFKHIEIAEAAIRTRRESLGDSSSHQTERQEIEDALAHICFLKKARLGLTDMEELDY
jgi:hypothetical protein